MTHNEFGGKWTEEKLAALSEYLIQYRTILAKYPYFNTWYIDGFAGTGFIKKKIKDHPSLFSSEDQILVNQYRKGSVVKALELNNPFDHYLFIEKDNDCFGELSKTVNQFNNPNVNLKCGDANDKIIEWINRVPHKSTRAVLFLDPYGMSVNWPTMELIAESQIIDTWILFPLGTGVNRLLKRDGDIPLLWQQRLDNYFGTHEWFTEFYKSSNQGTLFDMAPTLEKVANEKDIGYYFYKRLGSIFYKVSNYCGILANEKGSSLFLLFFAASNKKGSNAAIKISTYLIKNRFKNVFSF
jgi:three-Cys-motif partner protein